MMNVAERDVANMKRGAMEVVRSLYERRIQATISGFGVLTGLVSGSYTRAWRPAQPLCAA